MANYDVYDLKAAKVGEVELADEVFACEVNTQAIFDAVLRQQSSWRQGTHKVKNRREVSKFAAVVRSLGDRRVQAVQDRVHLVQFSTEVAVSHLVQLQEAILSSLTVR